MTKLYKVTVNNWGRSSPKTIYTTSKEAAKKKSRQDILQAIRYNMPGAIRTATCQKFSRNMARKKIKNILGGYKK